VRSDVLGVKWEEGRFLKTSSSHMERLDAADLRELIPFE
jgi:hypothetical protein